MKPLRILVADDHPYVREGLLALLARDGMEIVGEAADGRQAVELYRLCQPDITLMDLRMPEMDGLQAIRAILAESPRARIIVLTNLDGQEHACLQAGARAMLLKDVAKEELLATIRGVHEGSGTEL